MKLIHVTLILTIAYFASILILKGNGVPQRTAEYVQMRGAK